MYSGSYLLHLYCDICNKFEENFEGQTLSKCVIDARKRGWIVKLEKRRHIIKILCPTCKRK